MVGMERRHLSWQRGIQTLVFLAVSGGLVLAAGGTALYATQQRQPAAA
jgi:hypothetical protein